MSIQVYTADGELKTAGGSVSSADETVKVSSNDAVAGYLNGKLVAGSGITLTENNNGGDETLTIAVKGPSGSAPTGAMMVWSTDTPPDGWLLCAGQQVSRTTYSALYALLGATYGAGDGSTTFNLPDLRGRVPLGKDNMGGTSANRVTATQADNLGQGSGAETHTLSVNEMPTHAHNRNTNGVAEYLLVLPGSTGHSAGGAGTSTAFTVTGNAGGGLAHNNMPPYITVNYIIKT